MKNTTLLIIIGITILFVGGFVFSKGSTVTGKVITENPGVIQGNIQKILIGQKNFNYYPSEIKVKANQPVEITLGPEVRGCLRSFSIRDLGVSKYAKTPEDKIVFTPMKKGAYTFSCSMGMGYGRLIVE